MNEWSLTPPGTPSTSDYPVRATDGFDALLRRIEADNAYDVEFYARAVEMVDRRATAVR